MNMKKMILIGGVLLFSACATTTKDIDLYTSKAKIGDSLSLEKLKEQARIYLKNPGWPKADPAAEAVGKYAFEQLCNNVTAKGVLPFLVRTEIELLNRSELGNPWRGADKFSVANINMLHKAFSAIPEGTTVSAEDAKAGRELLQEQISWAKKTEATGNILGYVPTQRGSVYDVLREKYEPMEWFNKKIIALTP